MAQPTPVERQEGDALARTYLANERTELAWWRTGFTVIAVALAIGRVVPEIADAQTTWPYVTLGVAYAVYGVGLIVYGSARSRAVDTSLARGQFAPRADLSSRAIAGTAALLGLLTALLIAID